MDVKNLGLAFCEDGLQYFIDYRFETRKLKGYTGITAQQKVLIITKPNGEKRIIRDMVIKTDKGTTLYRAEDAIYRYPKEAK